MDTARAAEVSARIEECSPADSTLAALAAEGQVFTNASAPAPWTLPSHGSLFTGTYPSKHGAHADHKRLDGRLTTLAEAFGRAGYETVCLTNNVWITETFGFDRGFETVYKPWQYVQTDTDFGEIQIRQEGLAKYRTAARALVDGDVLANAANALYGRFLYRRNDYGAGRTNALVRRWLRSRSADSPFFLFVNYLEPHIEYQPLERFARRHLPTDVTYEDAREVSQDAWAYVLGKTDHTERELSALQALYRAEIDYLDARLSELRATLDAADEWDDTVVVLTSDHGENVGDHGLMDHQYCLYETLLHVPLIVRGGGFGRGETDDLVQLTDLLPTLLDAAGIEAPATREQAQGRSLHPDVEEPPRKRAIAEYIGPQPSIESLERKFDDRPAAIDRYDRRLRAIRIGEEKLIRGSDGSVELYDLADDPEETNDLAPSRPGHVESLAGELDAWLGSFDHARHDESVTMDAGTKQRLEDLGYL